MSQRNTDSLTKDKTITSTVESIEIIKTIFDWSAEWTEAKRHSLSHCLLRIYNDTSAKRTAVIASQLNSNRQNIAIGYDFKGLALAVMQKFGSSVCKPISQVIWIQHYGQFSVPMSYENSWVRDSFYKIDFPVLEISELKVSVKETALGVEEVQELIGWTNLEPVTEVLSEFSDVSSTK